MFLGPSRGYCLWPERASDICLLAGVSVGAPLDNFWVRNKSMHAFLFKVSNSKFGLEFIVFLACVVAFESKAWLEWGGGGGLRVCH